MNPSGFTETSALLRPGRYALNSFSSGHVLNSAIVRDGNALTAE